MELNKSGTTVCLTTHYLEEAEKLCDYITIIDQGKILKNDTKNNLLNLIGKKTVSFVLDKNINIPDELQNFSPEIIDNKLLIHYDKKITTLKEIINVLQKNNINFNEINTYESDLEDVFLSLINKKSK